MSQTDSTRDTESDNVFTAEVQSRAPGTDIPRFLLYAADVGHHSSYNGNISLDNDAFLIYDKDNWTGTVGDKKSDDEVVDVKKIGPMYKATLRQEIPETSTHHSGEWSKSTYDAVKPTEHVFFSAVPMSGVRQRGHHKSSKFGQTRLEDYSVVMVPYGEIKLQCCAPGIEPEESGFSCIAPRPKKKWTRDSISKEDRQVQYSLWMKSMPETEGETHVILPDEGQPRTFNSLEADELNVNAFYRDGEGPGEEGYQSDRQTCGDETVLHEKPKPQNDSTTQKARRRTRYQGPRQ